MSNTKIYRDMMIARRLLAGLCVCCGVREHLSGKRYCQLCSDKNAQYGKDRRQKLLSRGLCVCCGRYPAIEGLTVCCYCKNKQKEQDDNAKSLGLCVKCRKPVIGIPGYRCESCVDGDLERNFIFYKRVIDYLGGSCLICGISGYDHEIYDGHHLDPDDKEIKISNLSRSPAQWETGVLPEINKCVLLCANCHRRLHKNRFPQEIIDVLLPGKRSSDISTVPPVILKFRLENVSSCSRLVTEEESLKYRSIHKLQ